MLCFIRLFSTELSHVFFFVSLFSFSCDRMQVDALAVLLVLFSFFLVFKVAVQEIHLRISGSGKQL